MVRLSLSMALALAGLVGQVPVAPACSPDHEEESVSKPDHDAVQEAVERSGDRELMDLLRGPDSYVVRPETTPGAENHRVYRVLFTATDHPMSFYLATGSDGGQATVLTGQLAAVRDFLYAEPKVLGADDVVARFHDLYRHQGVSSRILDAPSPQVERSGGELVLRYAVLMGGEEETWTVELPREGRPSLQAR